MISNSLFPTLSGKQKMLQASSLEVSTFLEIEFENPTPLIQQRVLTERKKIVLEFKLSSINERLK